MPISLKCTCGAILEIDDRFRGQKIPCPDCQRPIDAIPPIAVPPPAWPMLPLLGLALAIGGLLTFAGPIAAIVLGVLSVRRLDRTSFPSERRLAFAATSVGCVSLVFCAWAWFAPNVLGLDAFYRVWKWGGKLRYGEAAVDFKFDDEKKGASMNVPGPRWGRIELNREVVLVDPWADAYVTALFADIPADGDDKHAARRRNAVEAFLKSEVANTLRGGPASGKEPDPAIRDVVVDQFEVVQEFQVDLPLGGIARTFMFRVYPTSKLLVFVGGARRGLWPSVADSIRESLRSGKDQQ